MAIECMSQKTALFVQELVDRGEDDAFIFMSLKASYPRMNLTTMERYIRSARAVVLDERCSHNTALTEDVSREFTRWQKFRSWVDAKRWFASMLLKIRV